MERTQHPLRKRPKKSHASPQPQLYIYICTTCTLDDMELGTRRQIPAMKNHRRPRSPHFHHCESLFLKKTQGIRVIDWVRHVRDQHRDPRQLRDQHCLPAGNWQIQIGSYQIRSTQKHIHSLPIQGLAFCSLLMTPTTTFLFYFLLSHDFHVYHVYGVSLGMGNNFLLYLGIPFVCIRRALWKEIRLGFFLCIVLPICMYV